MPTKKYQVRVLFVCTGNICRSPTAEGVFRQMVEKAGLGRRVNIDSAGTIAFHTGECPDQRSQKAARSRGINLSNLRARQINRHDFDDFDFLIALDHSHLKTLEAQVPENCDAELRLLMDCASKSTIEDVPDPYYCSPSGFNDVLNLIESAAAGLLQEIREESSNF